MVKKFIGFQGNVILVTLETTPIIDFVLIQKKKKNWFCALNETLDFNLIKSIFQGGVANFILSIFTKRMAFLLGVSWIVKHIFDIKLIRFHGNIILGTHKSTSII